MKLKISLLVILTFLIVTGVFTYFSVLPKVKALVAQADKTVIALDRVKLALKLQDIAQVKIESVNLKAELAKTKDQYDQLSFVKFIPLVNSYYSDGTHFLNAAEHGSQATIVISDALIPFADALGLKGNAGGNAGSYTEKIVQAMPKIVPKLDDIEIELTAVRKEIDQVNPNRYPGSLSIKGIKIHDTIEQVKNQIDSIESATPQLRPILTNLPDALGEPKIKTYLVLFQNDKELRPTGGFITAYALVKIDKGKLISTTSEDIYNLDARLNSKLEAPFPIKEYLKLNYLYIRDSNLSPDYVEAMKIFTSMYKRAPGSQNIDGVIALDTEVVRSLLQITGPITSPQYHETFSAQKNREGVSDVVYKLENYSENLLTKTDNRKALIGDLMQALISKIIGSSKDKWEPLLATTKDMLDQKHLLLYSFNNSTQELLEKYNFSGRIKDYSGDYLHINSANLGSKKANLYIKETIEQNIDIANDGTVTKTVKMTVRNFGPFNSWLNDTYRDWFRIYVPDNSQLISSSFGGSIGQELGKNVYSGLINVNPQGSNSVSVKYKLPLKVKKGEEYKLLTQKQPGTDQPEVIIKVNGKQIEDFPLLTDKEIKFKF